ncbi:MULTISPECIES: LysR family transcriptional regulator [Brevibacterium]|uniref:DNA-binding transcriptional regulator, LysR family n=2 Tax=Brevibacterium antiquum TaxID=234835 RepID=A0A2H1I592_9MICO|nr:MULTISPECIES: LysR family transcriptional regulator [Brevibacterium]SMX70284.1 DNA-binding transcriptional regulator, LysR family [Brevibacterium antiquum CNRZ 918]SMX82264.1 DNA-binding transcriptional regulator, LysR family [Brevibacterium antiquum]HCG55156.1 LysR family transcriptional regulator [Brevibacterium sp.]
MEVLDTRGLSALRAIAEFGSVAAAATALGWSQPTINHHLRNLERTLGSTLVEKSPRGSQPTVVGSLVVSRAIEILGLCDRLGAEVALWREAQAVPVKIGAVPTVGARVIPKLHNQLQRRPRWQAHDEMAAANPAAGEMTTAALDVTMDEHAKLVARLEAGDLDLALLVSTDIDKTWIPSTLTAKHLYSEQLFLCVPKFVGPVTLDEKGMPDLTALVSQTWAFSIDPGDAIDEVVRSFCVAAGFEPRVGMRMDDYAAIIRMIAAGLAVAVIPDSSVPEDPTVEVIPMPMDACRRDVLLVSRSRTSESRAKVSRHDPIIAAHHAAIAEVVADVRTVTAQWR